MTNQFSERRCEPRIIIDKYYSVELLIGDNSFVYQFKIWNISTKGICLVIREDSDVLKHLNVGDIVNMKYYTTDSEKPGEYLKTEIRHMTKDEGRFKGHYLVGLLVLERPES